MPVPVINVAQMREWEQASWSAGRTEAEVIEQVGRAVAKRMLQLTEEGNHILLLAGKGHNGDDVRQAMPHLSGRRATLINVQDPVTAMRELSAALDQKPNWIVDGLFGIGLNRPLEGAWAALIERINQSKLPVLAVDVPSGLNADTGAVRGAAIKAAVTLTIGAPKIGLLQTQATSHVGRLEAASNIGLVPCSIKSELHWTLAEDFDGFPPRRSVNGHKGSYGHLAIIAGSTGYHGAAVMSARAAERAMPGLISVLTPQEVYVPVASQLSAAMVHSLRFDHPLFTEADVLLAGPGLAAPELQPEAKLHIAQLWHQSPLAMVVDASALDWLKPGSFASPNTRVITPHPGEAARLLKTTVATVQQDRVKALRELSRQLGDCWVVLKGHQTLVGRTSGDIFVNSTGNPGLAQGGTGDVLAGYLAGLLAQPGLRGDDASQVIRYAVWQHGVTADWLAKSRKAWTVADLLAGLGNCNVA